MNIIKSITDIETASYGGKSLAENFSNVEKSLAKMGYMERIWDRSRSQFMIKHLTCSQADDWMRMRQICAEMAKKRSALVEVKFKYQKNQLEAEIKREEALELEGAKAKLKLVEAEELDAYTVEIMVKVEGALKEIETLSDMYDSLKERLGDITEEEYEKAQVKAHIKRAVMQATRNMREVGTIKEGNQEYLEQCGVCVTSARDEIVKYLVHEADGVTNTTLLHSFIQDFADRYCDVSRVQAEWLGFESNANVNLTYEK